MKGSQVLTLTTSHSINPIGKGKYGQLHHIPYMYQRHETVQGKQGHLHHIPYTHQRHGTGQGKYGYSHHILYYTYVRWNVSASIQPCANTPIHRSYTDRNGHDMWGMYAKITTLFRLWSTIKCLLLCFVPGARQICETSRKKNPKKWNKKQTMANRDIVLKKDATYTLKDQKNNREAFWEATRQQQIK